MKAVCSSLTPPFCQSGFTRWNISMASALLLRAP
jgi:hypothetical protein